MPILYMQVKKVCNSKKKNWIKIAWKYAHLHIISFIITKFHKKLFFKNYLSSEK